MKLHFEPDLDFQLQAVEAVCDLFRGQEINQTEFTLTPQLKSMTDSGIQGELGIVENELGSGNPAFPIRRSNPGKPERTSSFATGCRPRAP